jgi:hypothetical protein
MATDTLQGQPMQAAEDIYAADDQPHEDYLPSQPEDAIPDSKSGVRVDPDAAMVSSELSITQTIPSHNALGERALQKGRCCSEASLRQRHADQGRLYNLRPQTQSCGLCRVPAQELLRPTGRIWMDSRKGIETR